MTEIQNKFIDLAINHGKAIEEGNHKIANKIHSELTFMYNNQIKKNDRYEELEDILKKSDNESVRIWAATYLLVSKECLALETLKKLEKSNKIFGLTASTTIDMWKKGMLQL